MPKFIERPAQWLVRALMLRPGDAPAQLGDEVTPVAETIQGGHANPLWETVADATTMTGATQLFVLAPRSEISSYLVRGSVIRGGALGTISVRISSAVNDGTANAARLYDDPAWAAAAPILDWRVLGANSGGWWYIPPGFSLMLRLVGTAGDTAEWRFQRGTFPAGTKPF